MRIMPAQTMRINTKRMSKRTEEIFEWIIDLHYRSQNILIITEPAGFIW